MCLGVYSQYYEFDTFSPQQPHSRVLRSLSLTNSLIPFNSPSFDAIISKFIFNFFFHHHRHHVTTSPPSTTQVDKNQKFQKPLQSTYFIAIKSNFAIIFAEYHYFHVILPFFSHIAPFMYLTNYTLVGIVSSVPGRSPCASPCVAGSIPV